MTNKEAMAGVSAKKRALQSVICGVLNWIYMWLHWCRWWHDDVTCAYISSGYELKTAVGTSVFIMAFTAFTGADLICHWWEFTDVKVWILQFYSH